MAMKKCKECGEEISSSAKKCPKCGKEQRNFFMQHPVFYTIIILIALGMFVGNNENKTTTLTGQNSNEIATANISNKNVQTISNENKVQKYTLGDTFYFSNFELTFGTSITFDTVDNQFSDNNGDTVIVLPVTIKNNNQETSRLNQFYYKEFGSQGVELDRISAYFDNAIDDMPDLRTGASVSANFYLLYDGNGTYAIDFNNYSEKITFEFNVEK